MENEIDPELLAIQEAKHQQLQDKLDIYEELLRQGMNRKEEEPPVILPKAVSRSILERNVDSARSSVSLEDDNNRLYYENQVLKNRIQEVMRLSELAWNENATLTSKNLELQNQIQMQSGIGKTIETLQSEMTRLKGEVQEMKRDGVFVTPEKRKALQKEMQKSWEDLDKNLEEAREGHVFVGKFFGGIVLTLLIVFVINLIQTF